MEFRTLYHVDDLSAVVDLEIAVWGMHPRDVVPLNVLRVITITGGVVIGAFDGENIVGVTVGLPSRRHNPPTLWSHMAGVLPEYRSMRIGFQLKQRQREWALENGYEFIRWTFDPMQARNANFNLRYLGVNTNILHHNFYGEMQDSINIGMPTDRLEVAWHLTSPNVVELAGSGGMPVNGNDGTSINRIPSLLENTRRGLIASPCDAAECYRIEIPHDLNALKNDNLPLAIEWAAAVRHTLDTCFEKGFVIRSFAQFDDRAWYLLFTD